MVSTLTYAAVAAAAVFSTADAHQRITIPEPKLTTDRVTATNPLAFLENQGVKTSDDLTSYFNSKGIKTLRHFMDNKANYKVEAAGATFECGYTDPNGPRQPVPANGMMRSTGFTHDGPCEVWIDNTRVLGSKSGNCHKDIGQGMVSYKIDFSKCKGDCMIRWYWLGMRKLGSKWSWQVYKACIPIKGTGARELDGEGDYGYDEYGSSNGNSTDAGDAATYDEPTEVPTADSSAPAEPTDDGSAPADIDGSLPAEPTDDSSLPVEPSTDDEPTEEPESASVAPSKCGVKK